MKKEEKNTDRHGLARIEEGLIPKHGGFRNLKTFQLSGLIYDVTFLFCNKFVNPRSRTHDQMVQAARPAPMGTRPSGADAPQGATLFDARRI